MVLFVVLLFVLPLSVLLVNERLFPPGIAVVDPLGRSRAQGGSQHGLDATDRQLGGLD